VSLRVLSANLRFGKADPEAFADLVRRTRAEVVAVQELGPAQAEALARILPHGHLEPRGDSLGMGIALARPARLARIPLGWRDAHAAELDPAEWPALAAPLEVLNVHMRNPIHPSWTRARTLQLRGVLAHLDASPARPRVLLGDLNATPLWPVYRRLAARLDDLALRDASRRGRRPARTWPRAPLGLRALRIDHCLARGCEVERVEVHELPGSDHCALFVALAALGPGGRV
jgi:endonuclease/exonuclease/phosphatase (EEP) superfamily protein YafD